MKKRLGIIQGEQTTGLLAAYAGSLGFEVKIIDPKKFSDNEIKSLTKEIDYLTLDTKIPEVDFLKKLQKNQILINPSPEIHEILSDKLTQKQFLQRNKIPVTRFEEVKTKYNILKIIDDFGLPILLKSRFDSAKIIIKKPSQIDQALKQFEGNPVYAEKFVHFKKELTVIIAKDFKSQFATYPIVETVYKNNLRELAIAPARITSATRQKILILAKNLAKLLKGAGIFTIEIFFTRNNKILVNEVLPHINNSSFFSLESCYTSVFEQQIRAITNLPLGSTQMKIPAAVMVNIFNEDEKDPEITGLEKALAIKGVSLHIIDTKINSHSSPVGHLIALGKSLDIAMKKVQRAIKYLNL